MPAHRSRRVAAGEATLGSFMMILKGNKQAFERTQWSERGDQDQRPPQYGMHPIRRGIENFHRKRRAGDNESGKKRDEERRTVGGIDERIVEGTHVAARPQGQKSLEQLALATTRTTPPEARHHE